ncbi:MAG TPA: hypothetical protein VMF31_03310 [Solirubrobacterales bacterium]|nr:hypothetical protein [Solirubrobacterales bacterium]
MPLSASHGIPTPAGSDPATIPTHLKAMADKIDSELDAIAPSQITGAVAGQLLIANASGVIIAQAITGDASISSSGALKIGTAKVDTPEIKDSAVTSAKTADGAVIRRHIPKTFIQTKRILIINQPSGGSPVEHSVTWDTPFPNTSYTVVASLLNTATTAVGLRIVRFTTKLNASVKVLVENTGPETSATLSVMAIGD